MSAHLARIVTTQLAAQAALASPADRERLITGDAVAPSNSADVALVACQQAATETVSAGICGRPFSAVDTTGDTSLKAAP